MGLSHLQGLPSQPVQGGSSSNENEPMMVDQNVDQNVQGGLDEVPAAGGSNPTAVEGSNPSAVEEPAAGPSNPGQ